MSTTMCHTRVKLQPSTRQDKLAQLFQYCPMARIPGNVVVSLQYFSCMIIESPVVYCPYVKHQISSSAVSNVMFCV